MLKCQFLVIGSGKTGLLVAREVTAFIQSQNADKDIDKNLFQNVILVENNELGGSYLNYLDMPKELLAKEANKFSTVLDLFIDNGGNRAFEELQKYRDSILTKLKNNLSALKDELKNSLASSKDLQIIQGNARFTSKSLVEITEINKNSRSNQDQKTIINFQTAILAVGKEFAEVIPNNKNTLNQIELSKLDLRIDNLKKFKSGNLLSPENVFLQEKLPTKMAVIGLTAENLEIVEIMARLGTKVTVFEAKKNTEALPNLDSSLFNFCLKTLAKYKVKFRFNTRIKEIKPTQSLSKSEVKVDGVTLLDQKNQTEEFESVYISSGKKFIDTLNLPIVDIKFDSRGIFTTPDGRTTQKNILAFGEANAYLKSSETISLLNDYLNNISFNFQTKQTLMYLGGSIGNGFNSLPFFKEKAENIKNLSKALPKVELFKIRLLEPVMNFGLTETKALKEYGKSILVKVYKQPLISGFVKIIYKETGQILGVGLAGNLGSLLESYFWLVLQKKLNYTETVQFLKSQYEVLAVE